jgi:hypothetical protein
MREGKTLMNIRKRIISLFLAIVMWLTTLYIMPAQEIKAAVTYITIEDFAEYLSKELWLDAVNGNEESRNINRLIETGIIKDGDFTTYKNYLTRGDAMVLLNRADEYLYGETLDEELVQLAIDKRISDISKVKECKKEDVAKAYLKGYVMGYSNGQYTTDRTMKVKNKITKSGVLNCLKMLKNKSLRAKISPDGQLIRTTKLPVYAKYYPYILASFPNTYYDWKFQFETTERMGTRPDGTYGYWPYIHMEDYVSPAELTEDYFDADVTEEYFDVWVEKVRTHLECVFDVDYRTINEDWVQKIWHTDFYVGDIRQNEEIQQNVIREYVEDMIENKTVVKSSTIAVDRSSIYYFDGSYHVRVYVKYCIASSNVKYADKDKLKKKTDYYFNNILFSKFYVDFNDFTIGEWRESCYDVVLVNNQVTGSDKLKLGVRTTYLIEGMYTRNKVK